MGGTVWSEQKLTTPKIQLSALPPTSHDPTRSDSASVPELDTVNNFTWEGAEFASSCETSSPPSLPPESTDHCREFTLKG